MKKALIAIVIVLLVAGGVYAWNTKTTSQSVPAKTAGTPTSPTTEKIYNQLPELMPEAQWSEPVQANKETFYGNASGVTRTATIKTQKAYIPHFGQSTFFKDLGYEADKNLDADGPGSSQWGYTKTVDGKKQYVIFGYNVKPTNNNPNEPVQFNCPCQTTMTLFVGNQQ
jgi:hypothetical protein